MIDDGYDDEAYNLPFILIIGTCRLGCTVAIPLDDSITFQRWLTRNSRAVTLVTSLHSRSPEGMMCNIPSIQMHDTRCRRVSSSKNGTNCVARRDECLAHCRPIPWIDELPCVLKLGMPRDWPETAERQEGYRRRSQTMSFCSRRRQRRTGLVLALVSFNVSLKIASSATLIGRDRVAGYMEARP